VLACFERHSNFIYNIFKYQAILQTKREQIFKRKVCALYFSLNVNFAKSPHQRRGNFEKKYEFKNNDILIYIRVC